MPRGQRQLCTRISGGGGQHFGVDGVPFLVRNFGTERPLGHGTAEADHGECWT
jgi:hypothetical protein